MMNWSDIIAALRSPTGESNPSKTLEIFQRVLTRLCVDAGLGLDEVRTEEESEALFVEATKRLASKHRLLRKIAGWICLTVANGKGFDSYGHRSHLLAVNSLLENCASHADAVTRAKALNVIRHLRSPDLASLRWRMTLKSMEDTAEYVRRTSLTAARGLERSKPVDQDPRVVVTTTPTLPSPSVSSAPSTASERPSPSDARSPPSSTEDVLISRLTAAARDFSDPYSAVNALVVLDSLDISFFPTSTPVLNEELCLAFLENLDRFPASSKRLVLATWTHYAKAWRENAATPDVGPLKEGEAHRGRDWTLERVLQLLNCVDGEMEGEDAAVALLSVEFMIAVIGDSDDTRHLLDPLLTRAVPSLVRHASNASPEVAAEIMDFVRLHANSPRIAQTVFREGRQWLLPSAFDTTLLVIRKLNTLSTLSNFLVASDPNFVDDVLGCVSSIASTSKNRRILTACFEVVARSTISSWEASRKSNCEAESGENGCKNLASFRKCSRFLVGAANKPSPFLVAASIAASTRIFESFVLDFRDGGKNEEGFKDVLDFVRGFVETFPRGVLVLLKASFLARQEALAAMLRIIFLASSLMPEMVFSYLLEDVFDLHFSAPLPREFSPGLKQDFLFCVARCFKRHPNASLPLLKSCLPKMCGESGSCLKTSFRLVADAIVNGSVNDF